MDVGLFLDVDNTLTSGFIQQGYARLLKKEDEYLAIESPFQKGEISAETFGERLIALFNTTEFTAEYARRNFIGIKLAPHTKNLLTLPVSIYFVSAGPSYFVHKLAAEYDIPLDHVLCSVYSFDNNGKLLGCDAVSPQKKSFFREQKAKHHFVTIGVGDDERHDTPFLTGCTIPILTTRNSSYLYAENLAVVEDLVKNIAAR
jgi:phosphoserine phosphatase